MRDLCSPTGRRAYEGPELGLVFCCHHLEVLNDFKQGACIFVWHWALKLCNWSCCRQIQGNIFKPKQSLRKKLEMKRSTLMDSRAKYRQGSAPPPLCHQSFTSCNTQWEPRAYSHVPPAWALWCSSSQSQSPLGHCQLGLGSSTTMLLLVIVWNS